MGNKALSTLELYSSASDPTTPTLVAGAAYYNTTAKALRVYDGAAWVDFVNDETAQTIAGIKTFSTYAIFPAATTSIPSIRMPHGTAPSAPTNGDMWTTTTGVYARINGATQELVDTITTQTISGAKTFSTRVIGPAATTSISSFRAPHGVAPSAPVDGDIWTTTAGMYVRINGSTVGPLGASSISYATTTELANVDNAAESAGASSLVARGDHKHAVNSATAIALTGSAGAGTSTSLALADHQHGTSGLVLDTGTQTIAGAKTFSTSVIVSPGGTFQAGGWSGTSGMVQWISGQHFKLGSLAATSGVTTQDAFIEFYTEYWNGASSTPVGPKTFGLDQFGTASGSNRFYASTALAAGGSVVSTLSSDAYQVGINASTTNTDNAFFVYNDGSGYVLQMDNRGRFQTYDSTDMTTKGGIIVGGTGGGRIRTVGANGTVLTADSGDARGVTWVDNAIPIVLSAYGSLSVATGVSRVGVEGNYTIKGVRARVNTAPTGASIKVDVNKNGTTIFTTQTNRPDIAVSTNASSYVTNMDVTTLAAGDYLTVDVDQVGSTVEGSHLTVTIWIVRTS